MIDIKKEKIRESNYELLRIMSMFLIVLFHALSYSGFLYKATGPYRFLVYFIKELTLLHVNSFILVTGYFQCKGKMKLSKAVAINNATWFYKVLILLIFLYLGCFKTFPTNMEIVTTLLPIDFGTYWFIGCYIVLYLISPILNKVIDNSSKKELQTTILILMFILSGLCLITTDLFYSNNCGRSLATFILLYFIGAYLRLYPLDKNKLIKKIPKVKLKKYCIVIIIFLAFINCIFELVASKYLVQTRIITLIARMFDYIASSYSSPLIIIQTIAYFLFFSTLKIESKIINSIASCMIGIYLIHENKFVRDVLYKKVGITSIKIIDLKAIIYLFLLAIGIFLVCLIIEFIRKKIFGYFYELKASEKIRGNISKKVEENLNLKW